MATYRDTGEPDVPDSEVTLADGTKLDDVHDDLVDEILAKAGRPSLTGTGQHSPQIAFRLPADQRAAAEAAAAREGITVSKLARRALADYLNRAG